MYKKKRRELEITFYYGLRTRTQTWTLIYISKYHFMKLYDFVIIVLINDTMVKN